MADKEEQLITDIFDKVDAGILEGLISIDTLKDTQDSEESNESGSV